MKILFTIFIGCQVVHAQNIDLQSIYKMQLYLDASPKIWKKEQSIQKNDSVYKLFSDTYSFKLNELKSNDYYQYFTDIKFMELLIYDIKKGIFADNIIINNEAPEVINPYTIGVGKGDRYVLAINTKNGKSYRLQGFNGNDFIELAENFIADYNFSSSKKIHLKDFIKNFAVENIDLECLSEGLLSKKMNREQFPCLTRVSDLILVR